MESCPTVGELLVIENGPTIGLEGRPAPGTRHDIVFGSVTDTREPVAVKIERIPGALERERIAMTWLGERHSPVPRLVFAGSAIFGEDRARCLVIERRPGSPPMTAEGWRRMGRAHARLAGQPPPPAGLPVLDPVRFGRRHAERVAELGDRLAPLGASIADWEQLTSADVPGSPPLVITHGDPGPGNFLDDGGDGTVIDWEEAHIGPQGLDLARLVFIALLGAGPSGYLARDHRARAGAALAGYLEALEGSWKPARGELRWWITVAGIQFIHRRWTLGDRPAPWSEAAEVLHDAFAVSRYPG